MASSKHFVFRNSWFLLTVLVFGLAVIIMGATTTIAANSKAKDGSTAKEENKENVATGTVAGFGKYKSGKAFDVDSGSEFAGEEKSVVTGGISMKGRDKCVAVLRNSSEKNSYSVRYKVLLQRKGKTVSTKYFSARVPKTGSTKKEFSCRGGIDGARLAISSASKS